MSLRQIFVGLHKQVARMRQLYQIHGHIAKQQQQQAIQAPWGATTVGVGRKVLLRVPRPLPPPPVTSAATTWREVFRGILGLNVLQEARRTTVFLRRLAVRHGRPVAPLLGFIAAFLRESKTDEFKTNAACGAAREDANEFSKANVDQQKPPLDLSGFRKISDLEFGKPLGKGCNAAVYEARMRQTVDPAPAKSYDLAVKVLFNYSNHSNADEVSRIFQNELLPSRLRHLNIIDVFQALVDEVPRLPECDRLFPSALPARLHPEGLGRNQTMFVLMNKYSCTLRDDLLKRSKYELSEGLAVFAQLLEGLVKLGKENVCHRDLKSDNILLVKQGESIARAVLSDFGCSLNSLKLKYTSPLIPKGGNRALMAPEVVNASAGLFSVIDYSRSDLWAIGTVGYEIFAGFNPFFEGIFKLDSANYDDTRLPEVIAENGPLNNLIHGILRRDPSKRPSPSLAATACHMMLWDFPLEKIPTLETVRLWIMCLCVKLICGSRQHPMHRALLATFLKRCQLTEIMEGWKLLTVSTVYWQNSPNSHRPDSF
ncbi:Serine/threonine-protein kinase PINK1, mitochondrial [Hypsibius exemplaris]|uniref:non-specific serine/threonine protein kinase n=1 Tax=Hypsibius exemplaris TaxID=2072580 RepID=A0A1W0WUC7_HYPEX|nr:Serine/threonine-protein kinase PINK1, mitochondrial [Hypsibius exemplaris]